LPTDWEAWTAVELVELPDVAPDEPDLTALIPLEWTKIAFGGGISLPGYSTWLRDAPPEIRVTSLIDTEVQANLTQTMSLAAAPPTEEELASFEGAAVINLDGGSFSDGDYRVSLREAKRQGKALISSGFRLRSGDFPRLSVDLEGELQYSLSSRAPLAALSAQVVDELSPPYITGAAIALDVVPTLEPAGPIPEKLVSAPPIELESETDLEDVPTEARSGVLPNCLMKGGHQFRLPDADRDVMMGKKRPAKIDARCVNCGFEKWFPPHLRKARPKGTKPKAATAIAAEARVVARPEITPIGEGSSPGLDALLNALTYSRGGRWELFERLAQQVGSEPWFALEAARTLSSLGHIDLVTDLSTGRPTHWAVSPTALCMTTKGVVLCGARSTRLLARLQSDVDALGGGLLIENNTGAPSTVRVVEVDEEDLELLVDSLATALNERVRISRGGARAIAAALPSLASVRRALPTITWPAVAFERFDLYANRWVKAGAIDRSGAYKFLTRPLRYGFVGRQDGGGSVIAGDNRLVKWLAAQSEGVSLLAYDSEHGLLTTRLGAQLPGLYERAAVLCTGSAPIRRVDGTVAYQNVPADVAGSLFDRLTAVEKGSS
jgi:hypothetical protein